ncbi:unnamed protein product [Pleuronectes platessa]|uniref:Uncharacterized protein n=1 Tax=Pleuronectes platessa TaxID=8262 RepID=A0A9N7U4K7_PLEPL|nr:unnamed protein product [Pleuronectes platessa]
MKLRGDQSRPEDPGLAVTSLACITDNEAQEQRQMLGETVSTFYYENYSAFPLTRFGPSVDLFRPQRSQRNRLGLNMDVDAKLDTGAAVSATAKPKTLLGVVETPAHLTTSHVSRQPKNA